MPRHQTAGLHVCHNGNGQCLCLHNGRRKRMPSTWTYGCVPTVKSVTATTGCRRLSWTLPTMPADNLWEDRDSRAVNAEIVQWAGRIRRPSMRAPIGMRRTTSLRSTGFYKERQNKWNPVTIPELKKWNAMDKEIAEEIIRENRYPSGYGHKTICLTMSILCFLEDGTSRSMTSTSGKDVRIEKLKRYGTTGPRLVDIR